MDLGSRASALESADVERVTLELADYAGRCLNRLRLGRYAAVDLDAEALTQDALERFLDGRWTWDPERHPSIADFLKSRIRSLISNALTSAEYRKGTEIPRRDDGSENIDAVSPAGIGAQNPSVDPHEVFLQKVDDDFAARFWAELDKMVRSVPDDTIRSQLESVLIAVYEGKDYGEIAEATGLSADIVYRRFYKLGDMAEALAAMLRAGTTKSSGGE